MNKEDLNPLIWNRKYEDPFHYELPMNEFMYYYEYSSAQIFGNEIVNKFAYDCEKIEIVSPTKNKGDFYCNGFYYENKMTKIIENKDKHVVISAVRPDESMDYFSIQIFFQDEEVTKFYVIKKDILLNHNLIRYSIYNRHRNEITCKIAINEIDFILGNQNLLKDTTYEAFLEFLNNDEIQSLNDIIPFNRIKESEKETVEIKKHLPITHVCYVLDGVKITGATNKETLKNLYLRIGPEYVALALPEAKISKIKSKYVKDKLNDQYYYNGEIGASKVHQIVNVLNKKLNLNIKIEKNETK